MPEFKVDESQVYSVIGEEGFARLTHHFYQGVAADEVLSSMYPEHDLAGAEQRLRDFLVFRFGGPNRYIEERGHPRLRMRHAPFRIDQSARDRWMRIMENALHAASIPDDCAEILRRFFDSAASFMINSPTE